MMWSKGIFSMTLGLWSVLSLAQEKTYPPFEELTEIENPFEMRDPFLPPESFLEQSLIGGGNLTVPIGDPMRVLETLKDFSQIKIIGILKSNGSNRAMVEVEGKTHLLQEGMVVGEEGATILAIREKGMVLGEEKLNIYRKKELFEKIIQVNGQEGQKIIVRRSKNTGV